MKRVLLLAVVLGAGCYPTPRRVDGGPDCEAACVRVREVCSIDTCSDAEHELAAPTPAGAPCEAWRCQQGYPHEKNACLARATSAADLRACKGVGR